MTPVSYRQIVNGMTIHLVATCPKWPTPKKVKTAASCCPGNARLGSLMPKSAILANVSFYAGARKRARGALRAASSVPRHSQWPKLRPPVLQRSEWYGRSPAWALAVAKRVIPLDRCAVLPPSNTIWHRRRSGTAWVGYG